MEVSLFISIYIPIIRDDYMSLWNCNIIIIILTKKKCIPTNENSELKYYLYNIYIKDNLIISC